MQGAQIRSSGRATAYGSPASAGTTTTTNKSRITRD